MSKRALLSGLALAISLSAAFTAQADNEQYFPLQSYRVGPYAAGGTGFLVALSTTSSTSMPRAGSTASS